MLFFLFTKNKIKIKFYHDINIIMDNIITNPNEYYNTSKIYNVDELEIKKN